MAPSASRPGVAPLLAADDVIALLALEANPQGGWFRSVHAVAPLDGGRPVATTINYLLDAAAPISWFHRTTADALHYFHQGGPLTVHTIDPSGALHREVLGPDLAGGQQLQVHVPGGHWKAFELEDGPWALISEVVTPGWIPEDQDEATADLCADVAPEDRALVERLVRP